MEQKNNPLVLFIAWLNYIVSYLFSAPILSKIALILSIIGSLFYIYNQIIKLKKNKKDVSKINQ